MRRSQGLRFSFDHRLAAVGGMNAEDHLRGFGAPGSEQSRQANDLAGPHVQIERRDGAFFAVPLERGDRFIAQ